MLMKILAPKQLYQSIKIAAPLWNTLNAWMMNCQLSRWTTNVPHRVKIGKWKQHDLWDIQGFLPAIMGMSQNDLISCISTPPKTNMDIKKVAIVEKNIPCIEIPEEISPHFFWGAPAVSFWRNSFKFPLVHDDSNTPGDAGESRQECWKQSDINV